MVWTELNGNALDGLFDPELEGRVDRSLLDYVRNVARLGAQARQPNINARWRTRPAPSVLEHIDEAFAKVWKDAHKGRILLCDADLDCLQGVLSTPQGRVAKMNPDRTLSGEGRFVHQQQLVNAFGSKYDHPPAVQPRHRALARVILWWKARLPGIQILLSKLDADSAYKIIWLNVDDVGLFATEFPGTHLKRTPDVLALSLCLTFGWGGSPGEYMPFAWVEKMLYESFKPAMPEWHDTIAYHCNTLMDDKCMVEPRVGIRPALAAHLAANCVRKVFGAQAVNAAKLAEEGELTVTKLNWGLLYDTETETMEYPEVKIAKVRFHVTEMELHARHCIS